MRRKAMPRKPTSEPGSALARALSPAHVRACLEATSKKRVLEQIGLLLENEGRLGYSQVYDSLFARERLGSTGIGMGVAIPHGRLSGLHQALGVFVRLARPVVWDAPDGQPVDLVFVLLMPEQAIDRHLLLLAELAERFVAPEFRQALRQAVTVEEIYRLFVTENPHAADQHPTAV